MSKQFLASASVPTKDIHCIIRQVHSTESIRQSISVHQLSHLCPVRSFTAGEALSHHTLSHKGSQRTKLQQPYNLPLDRTIEGVLHVTWHHCSLTHSLTHARAHTHAKAKTETVFANMLTRSKANCTALAIIKTILYRIYRAIYMVVHWLTLRKKARSTHGFM